MAMFNMTREPDTNLMRNKRLRVDCKRVSGQSDAGLPALTRLTNGSVSS